MRTSIYLIALIVLFTLSCKKEDPVVGCTDPSADNYNYLAEVSDNSCTYSTEIHFWLREATWQSYGGNTLNVFVGGQQIGSVQSSAVYLAAPFCSNVGVLVYETTLDPNGSLSYTVKNGSGTTVYTGSAPYVEGECVIEEIE
jgi:hypothetical protein